MDEPVRVLFDPVANLFGAWTGQAPDAPGSGLRIVVGDVAVGQVCCDPGAFADVTTVVAADGRGGACAGRADPMSVGALVLDDRVRALLRLVWPGDATWARRVWGVRIEARLRQRTAALTAEATNSLPEATPTTAEVTNRRPEATPTTAEVTNRRPEATPTTAGELHRYVDDLLPALVADVIGVPAAVLRRVVARCRTVGGWCDDAVARAAVPMTLLRAAVAGVVHDRAAEAAPEHAATVLDELLSWRGSGHDQVSLDAVATLVSALTAAAWDAAHGVLHRLVDAAVDGAGRSAWTGPAAGAAARADLVETAARRGPEMIGWLRTTTEAVLLDGAWIPAGTRCLLLVDATDPGDLPARPALRALRWLAPDAPRGAGAIFARLVGTALADCLAQPAGPWGKAHDDRPSWPRLPAGDEARPRVTGLPVVR